MKRFLLIFSERIFDSSVDRGMHNLAAAPVGPKTRPRLSFKAACTSHYFKTAHDLSFFVRGSDDPKQPGFYLIMAMSSEQAGSQGVDRFQILDVFLFQREAAEIRKYWRASYRSSNVDECLTLNSNV